MKLLNPHKNFNHDLEVAQITHVGHIRTISSIQLRFNVHTEILRIDYKSTTKILVVTLWMNHTPARPADPYGEFNRLSVGHGSVEGTRFKNDFLLFRGDGDFKCIRRCRTDEPYAAVRPAEGMPPAVNPVRKKKKRRIVLEIPP